MCLASRFLNQRLNYTPLMRAVLWDYIAEGNSSVSSALWSGCKEEDLNMAIAAQVFRAL